MSKKILIVDDSALMRKHLSRIITDAGYEVRTARDGAEGLEQVKAFDPSVVTLDINMPVMDGLTCLSLIMAQSPRPVVMVSSLTEKGALASFEALALGAVDVVGKPGGTVSLNIGEVAEELLTKIEAAAVAKIRRSRGLRERIRSTQAQAKAQGPAPHIGRPKIANPSSCSGELEVVLIGSSTGGPRVLDEIIPSLPRDFPVPILIAQHMPARFTRALAERLNRESAIEVQELTRQASLAPGQVWVARGGGDVKLFRRDGQLMARSMPVDERFLWHPSIERLTQSALELCQPRSVICVQLTGMGNDGAATMTELHKLGALTIAESEETATVFGMPKELIKMGGAERVLPSHEITNQLLQWAA